MRLIIRAVHLLMSIPTCHRGIMVAHASQRARILANLSIHPQLYSSMQQQTRPIIRRFLASCARMADGIATLPQRLRGGLRCGMTVRPAGTTIGVSGLAPLVCLSLLCAAALPAANVMENAAPAVYAESWMPPSGFADPENKWATEAQAYDASTATYASDQCNRVGDGPWLEMTYTQPLRSNQVWVVADFGYAIVDAVALEAKVNGVWTRLYSGPVANVAPSVITFPSLITTSFRFRFHYLQRGYHFWLYDFRAFAQPSVLTPPVVEVSSATSVTHFSAVLHGLLLSDGGDLCQARFGYQADGVATPTYTAWQGGLSTGQGANAVLTPIAGLQPGVTYAYWMEASNVQGRVLSGVAHVTPRALVPGVVDWISPSNAVGGTLGAMSWVDLMSAIDDDPATAARCNHPLGAASEGPAVTFDLPLVPVDQVRLLAGRNAYIRHAQISLRAAGSDTWLPIHAGPFIDRTWLTLPVPAGAYAQARVAFTTTTTAVGTAWELFTFQVRLMPTVLSIAASDASAAEPGDAGAITISRSGVDLEQELVVAVAVTGTASEASDYQSIGTRVLIPAGASSVVVPVTVLDDRDAEGTETVIVTLQTLAGSNYTLASPVSANVTISDDDVPTLSLTTQDNAASERNLDPGRFTINRTGSTAQALTVNLAWSGTASNGLDFAAQPTTVVIPAGQSSVVLMLTPLDDSVAELAETATLTLQVGDGYALVGTLAGTVTISDNEPPELVASVVTATAAEPTTAGKFRITRLGDKASALTAMYVMAGTATSDIDYNALAGSAILGANVVSVDITLTPKSDTVPEFAETAILTLVNGSGYTVDSSASATVTINDDETPEVQIEALDASGAEPTKDTILFRVVRRGNLAAAITVGYTIGGTATNGTDYTSLSGSIAVAKNSSQALITVTPKEDTVEEGAESVTLTLKPGTGYTLGSATVASSVIHDNDGTGKPVVSLTASDAHAGEPSDPGAIAITRSGSDTGALVVAYAVTGTATTGTDVQTLSGLATIPDGSTGTTVLIQPIDDGTAEASETVILTLLGSPDYAVHTTDNQKTVTITDDEVPVLTVAATDATAKEPGTSTDQGTFTITRVGSLSAAQTIAYAVTGTAAPGSDYSALGGTVSFDSNVATATVTVAPIHTSDSEPSETVVLSLQAGAGYNVGASLSATVTISDIDEAEVSIAPLVATGIEGASIKPSFRITRLGNLSTALSIPVTVGGTATSGSDYTALPTTVGLAANKVSTDVVVTTLNDAVVEPVETVIATIQPGANYRLSAASTATVAIHDTATPQVTIAVSPAGVPEDAGQELLYTLTRLGSQTSDLTVQLTASGSATPGLDYQGIPASVKILKGRSTVEVVARIQPDQDNDPDETVVLTVASGTGYTVGSPSAATGTIQTPPTPVFAWATPAAITYGTPLSATQLQATAILNGVPLDGSWTYEPPAGTILGAGLRTLTATFTPSDTVNLRPATVSTTITVTPARPVIAWADPAAIVYGTPLGAAELNASAIFAGATVSGSWTYTPAAGTVLDAGAQTLQATFTPDDTVNLTTATATTSLTVTRATPALAWATPATVSYGYQLSTNVLPATATLNGAPLDGSWTYDPPADTVLGVGIHALTATFTPSDTVNLRPATVSRILTVVPAEPDIAWEDPAPIVYGTALGAAELSASASCAGATVSGSWTYTPAAGTILDAGEQTLQATFTPDDTVNLTTSTATTRLTVTRATPALAWATPATISFSYGFQMSALVSQATATLNGAPLDGSWTYDPPADTVLGVGIHALTATFTPSDTVNLRPATVSTTITVTPARPVIAWADPAPIVYGTPLGAAELNASASFTGATVSGSWSYTPAAGTVLDTGAQTLQVVFTPDDTVNLTTATATTTIIVTPATLVLAWPAPAAIVHGTRLASAYLQPTATFHGTALDGSWTFAPAVGTMLDVGEHTLTATFTPTTTTFAAASISTTIEVLAAVPDDLGGNPTATVTCGIDAGSLTGVREWNGVQLTRQTNVQFQVQAADMTEGWSVDYAEVTTSAGMSFPGPADAIPAALPEGQQTISGAVCLIKGGIRYTVPGTQAVEVLVDRTPPVLTLQEPGDVDGTKRLDVGLIEAGGLPLLLNQAADAATLRSVPGWRTWSVEGLDIPVQVIDQSGVDAFAEVTATVGGSALTVAVDASAPGERGVLHLRDFAGLPESVTVDAATLFLAAGTGMQPLTVVVTDRCGNVTTSALCSVWKKTTAGGAAFGYVPYQDQGFPTTVGVLGPQQLSWLSPISLLATAADVIAVDQYLGTLGGVKQYQSALRLTPASNWDGLAGQGPALWELKPVPCDATGLMKTTLVLRDAAGNCARDVEVTTAWRSTRVVVPEVEAMPLITKVYEDDGERHYLSEGTWGGEMYWEGESYSHETGNRLSPYYAPGWETIWEGLQNGTQFYSWVGWPFWLYPQAAIATETEVSVPWSIDQQPTEGGSLSVNWESAPSCIDDAALTGWPEQPCYATVFQSYRSDFHIDWEAVWDDPDWSPNDGYPVVIGDYRGGISATISSEIPTKNARHERQSLVAFNDPNWETVVQSVVDRHVEDPMRGVMVWNTIRDDPVHPRMGSVPSSWTPPPVEYDYGRQADNGLVTVSDSTRPPIAVSPGANGNLEIPLTRNMTGGYTRVQRHMTDNRDVPYWQHLGFRGLNLVKVINDVVAPGLQTLIVEGAFQGQLSARTPGMNPSGSIRVLSSSRRALAEDRLKSLRPRSTDNIDIFAAFLNDIESDAHADIAAADGVADGTAAQDLTRSLLMRHRDVECAMGAVLRGATAASMKAQNWNEAGIALILGRHMDAYYYRHSVIRELWEGSVSTESHDELLSQAARFEEAIIASVKEAKLVISAQPGTRAAATAARQMLQDQLTLERMLIDALRIRRNEWLSFCFAVYDLPNTRFSEEVAIVQRLTVMASSYNDAMLANMPGYIDPQYPDGENYFYDYYSSWNHGYPAMTFWVTHFPFNIAEWNTNVENLRALVDVQQASGNAILYNLSRVIELYAIPPLSDTGDDVNTIVTAFADRSGSLDGLLAPLRIEAGSPTAGNMDPAVGIRQRCNIPLYIGAEAAGLYDIEINIGEVHADPSETILLGVHARTSTVSIDVMHVKVGWRIDIGNDTIIDVDYVYQYPNGVSINGTSSVTGDYYYNKTFYKGTNIKCVVGAHRMKEALCVYSVKPKKYDSSGTLGDLEDNKLPLSAPHPVITMGGADFTTTSTSPGDATTLPTVTGTISLSGNLTSGMCDITAGAQGQIDTVEVYLDHATTPFATVPVQVTKGTGQAPRKYPYAGSFAANLPVTLGMGSHTFTVRAKDKVIGKVGSADIVIECRAKPGQEPTPTHPSPAGFTVLENPLVAEVDLGAVDLDALVNGTGTLDMKVTSLIKNGPPLLAGPMRRQMKSLRGLVLAGNGLGLTTVESALRSAKAGTADTFSAIVECPSVTWKDRSVVFRRVEGSRFVTDYYTLRVTGSLGGGPIDVVIKRGPNGPEVAKELNKDGDSYSSSDGSVSMDIEPTQPADGQPAGATATVTSSDLGISGQKVQVQQSPTDGNVMSSDEVTGNEGDGDEEESGDDAELYVDYPEVTAQDDTEEFNPLAIEIDGPAEVVGKEDFRIQTNSGGRKVIQESGKYYLANEAGTERETMVLLRSQEAPTFNGGVFEDLSQLPIGTVEFVGGFIAGFSGGAAELVTGTGSVIYTAVETGGLFVLSLLPDGWGGETATDLAQARVDTAYEIGTEVVTAVSGIVKEIGERKDELIEAIILGDREKLSNIGEEYAIIFEMGFDVVSESTAVFVDDMSSYDQGKLFGRVVFEIASFVLPAAKAGNLAKLQKAAVLESAIAKIKAAEWFTKLPGAKQGKLIQAFEKVGSFIAKLKTTKMCFVAGTLVATDNGMVPIELVKAGDRVLSKDPETGSEGYRPVVDAFVTRPTRLHHIYYRAGHARRAHAVGAAGVMTVGDDEEGSDEPHGGMSELVCTAEHPFYVENRSSFVPAHLLEAGDQLSLAGGLTAVVEGNSIESAQRGESYITYNFEVADYHTYFVGAEKVWVHNAAPQACTRVFSMFDKRLEHNGNRAWQTYTETRDRISRLSDSVLLRLKLFNEARSRCFKESLFGDAGPWHNVAAQHLPAGVVGSPARLGTNMEKVLGITKPPGMASHHIVEKAANPEARAIIERAGLHIDEASNGVWMPTDLIIDEYNAAGRADWLQGVGPRHQGSHTGAYHQAVTARLTPLDGQPAAVIRDELQKIANELVEGSFPW
jgi:hypothetical protein